MTEKAKENLRRIELLGINIKSHDYDSCVTILLDKYTELAMSLDYEEEQKFKQDLLRVTKSKTN